MINVIGLGYIGLPTALMMSTHGIEVIGTDYNKELVATLNAGRTTFKEDGLDDLFQDAIKAGIRFTTEYQVTACYVISAVKDVLKVAPNNATLVIESTISPGTVEKSIRPVVESCDRLDINLVHAPERIIPRNMVYELLHNNRTIGADDKTIGEEVAKLHLQMNLRRFADMTAWMFMKLSEFVICTLVLIFSSQGPVLEAIVFRLIRGFLLAIIPVSLRLLTSQ